MYFPILSASNAHLKRWQFILLRDREKRIRTVAEGLKARDMKDRVEIEAFVSRFAECRSLFELNPLASGWMCVENIMLALAAEGLFGCTYTPYDSKGLRDSLGVPPDHQVAAVIPFGFPRKAPEAQKPENPDERRHIDTWGNRG